MNLATRIAALVATALIALTLLALPALNAYLALGIALLAGAALAFQGWQLNRALQLQLGGEPRALHDLAEQLAQGELPRTSQPQAARGSLLHSQQQTGEQLAALLAELSDCFAQWSEATGGVQRSAFEAAEALKRELEAEKAKSATVAHEQNAKMEVLSKEKNEKISNFDLAKSIDLAYLKQKTLDDSVLDEAAKRRIISVQVTRYITQAEKIISKVLYGEFN